MNWQAARWRSLIARQGTQDKRVGLPKPRKHRRRKPHPRGCNRPHGASKRRVIHGENYTTIFRGKVIVTVGRLCPWKEQAIQEAME
jgi:hypothetical protein